jgi:hypothetical protein
MGAAMACRLRIAIPLLGLCAVLPAQPGASTVEGDVTDSVTHRPIAGARVKLRAGERALFTRCDASGRFQIQEVPAGNLEVTADQPGYMPASQSVRAGGPVHLSLRRYAVVAGTVTDAAGVPVEGVSVDLLTLRPGEVKMMTTANASTNDLGEYRFARLSAGSYYVRAHPRIHRDESDEAEHATWYPRALQGALARAVAVAAGQEVLRIDIPLIRQAGVRIAGYASSPAGNPGGRAVMLHTNVAAWRLDAPREDEAMLPSFAEGGVFELKNFLPGQYVVEALTSDPTDFGHPRTLFAGRRTVEVLDKNIDGVEISMLPPRDVPGQVVFAANCPAVPVSIGAEIFSRLANFAPQDAAAATGAFTLTGLIPGKYTLTVRPLPAANANYRYSVASANLGGREILQGGFELAGQPVGALRIVMACSAREVAR